MSPHPSPTLGRAQLLSRMALFAALIAAGAFVHLPVGPVPVTFQDGLIALAGLALGPRHGTLAVGIYLMAGAAGLPVFAGGKGGLGCFIGPTAGYLLGFLFLAACAGLSGIAAKNYIARVKKSSPFSWLTYTFFWGIAILGCLIGLFCVYICGAAWLIFGLHFSWEGALMVGIAPFLPLSLPKMCIAVLLWRRLERSKVPW